MALPILAILVTSVLAAEPETASHVVTPEVPTLSEISTLLYGTRKRDREIADWNGIQPPYVILPGQKLSLRAAPTLSAEEGAARIREMRLRLGRIAEEAPPAAAAQPAVEPEPESPIETEVGYIPNVRVESPKAQAQKPVAEGDFERGKSQFRQGDHKGALMSFRRSRTQNPAKITYWIHEIRTLKELGRRQEAEKILAELKAKYPEAKDSPGFEFILYP